MKKLSRAARDAMTKQEREMMQREAAETKFAAAAREYLQAPNVEEVDANLIVATEAYRLWVEASQRMPTRLRG